MTTIALHKYLQVIEELIDDSQLDEAIDRCRHILEQYPRHVDTYRALAKAYLEKGNYEEAVDIIQRILSTDPTDFIAHVGLSIAFKEQSLLDHAVWHLERALDVEPYNSALRDELHELYVLKDAVPPVSAAPSGAALARMYLQSEMYNAAVVELRKSLAAEPDRIDLKVLLAETLWWANERVDAVSLSLEILDALPNCIPVNAILAEIWLQTGRLAEAQTYLKRLQVMTLVDKAHCDPDTAVGRAFLTRGAPPLPDEVAVEQYGPELKLDSGPDTAVAAAVDSDWIKEFTLEDTAEPPEEEAEDDKNDNWLAEAALATGEHFGTQPLVMPPDPLEAESNWLMNAGDEGEESLDDLLEGVEDEAQLDDWLAGLEGASLAPADEPEARESTGFTGMLTGLFDSQLEAVEETAVPDDFTDLFGDEAGDVVEETAVPDDFTDLFGEEIVDVAGETAEPPGFTALFDELAEKDEESEEATGIVSDSYADGLTTLFSDMDSAEPPEADLPDEDEDVDLDEFLASNLGMLAEADTPETEVEHTGYTQLFDQLSIDPFPEEPEKLDSNWLTPATDGLTPDLADMSDEADVPDWLSVKTDEFEPVRIKSDVTSEWFIDSDEPAKTADEAAEDDWLAELAGNESETAVPEAQPSDSDDDLADIPTWMLGKGQEVQIFETPAPLDFVESAGFDTGELEEEETAVPTWLLGGDKLSDETGALDESAPLDEIIPSESSQPREKPQAILAGEELPDWLREAEADEAEKTDVPDPLQTDTILALAREDLPDWLSSDLLDQKEPPAETPEPLGTDEMAGLASGELPGWLVDDEPDLEPQPIPEPDSEFDLYKDDVNIPDWLMADLSIGQDQTEVAVTGDKDERESISRQQPESSPGSASATSDGGALKWLDELAASADAPSVDTPSVNEPAKLMPEGDDSGVSYASRVAAGEGAAVEEPPTQVSMPDELPDAAEESPDFSWLEELGESIIEPVEEDLTLDWSQAEPEMDDVLAGVTGELNADLDWLDSLTEESNSLDAGVDEAFEDFDSGTGLLQDLAGDTGPLDQLGEEPILPNFEDSLAALPEEPEDGLDWLSELEEGVGLVEEPAELTVDPAEAEAGELEAAFSALDTEPGSDALPVQPGDSLDWLDAVADEADLDEFEPVPGLETDYSAVIGPEGEVEGAAFGDLNDMEEAMAWLEGLAAKQGARLEELPSLAEVQSPEPDDGDTPAAPDDSLEWLDELAGEPDGEQDERADILQALDLEEAGLESADAGLDWLETDEGLIDEAELPAPEEVEEEPETDLVEAEPDNIDEAMIWLEALAADQDAPAEELPLVTGSVEPGPDRLEFEAAAEPGFEDWPADLDDAMGWLEDLAAEQSTPLEDLPTIAAVVDEEPGLEPEPAAAVPPEADRPADRPEDELAEALDWLEQLALKDGRPLAGAVVKETAVSTRESELAEALDWLEQLARTEKKPDQPSEDAVDLVDLTEEMPEDPDEALAWLQRIAAEQEEMGAVEEELAVDLVETPPVVGAVEPEVKAVVEPEMEAEDLAEAETDADILAEMPDDPDAAMAWLERLAARQGARLEELPSVSAEDMADLVSEALPEVEPPADLAALPDEALPPLAGEPTEEVEDEVAWLDALVGEAEPSPDFAESLDLAEEVAVTPPIDETLDTVVEPEVAGLAEADLAELEVPEDLDDAMAWLEALAAQQGARLEELPSLTGTEARLPEPVDVMDEETAVVPEQVAAEVREIDTAVDVPDELPAAAEEEPSVVDGAFLEDEIDLSEGVDESLPDWLDADTDVFEAMPGQTQWLRDLDEPDIEGWLGEEETTISTSYDRTVRARFETRPEETFETGQMPSLPESMIDTGFFDIEEDEVTATVLALDEETLESARKAVKDGTLDDALSAYQTLVDAGGGMMTLIAELETVAADHPEQPLFGHLLGDAYMRNGQLQKALDTYRLALDQI